MYANWRSLQSVVEVVKEYWRYIDHISPAASWIFFGDVQCVSIFSNRTYQQLTSKNFSALHEKAYAPLQNTTTTHIKAIAVQATLLSFSRCQATTHIVQAEPKQFWDEGARARRDDEVERGWPANAGFVSRVVWPQAQVGRAHPPEGRSGSHKHARFSPTCPNEAKATYLHCEWPNSGTLEQQQGPHLPMSLTMQEEE